MSGVYISGMEMPAGCFACPMVSGYMLFREGEREPRVKAGLCRLNRKIEVQIDGRPQDCPLVPVPKHGRLIDGDYLKHTHCAECTLYPDKCLEKTADGCDWVSIIHLRMCPTIIPSDKEDGDESRT